MLENNIGLRDIFRNFVFKREINSAQEVLSISNIVFKVFAFVS